MVKVAEVVKAGNAQQRVFPARIESGDATDLAFKRAGQIETRTFAGVVVKQGQRLASLNDREARQRLNDRQTAATRSAAIRPLPDLGRTPCRVEGRDGCPARKPRFCKRRASDCTRRIESDDARRPFSGTAASVHVRNHQVVSAGQPVVTLTRTDLLDVVFSLPENLFNTFDIRNAQYKPVVRINALPGREFTAVYKEHSGSSDSNTLTGR